MTEIESKTTLNRTSSSFSSVEKGKLEINKFYDSVSVYCAWVIDKQLFESVAFIETLCGTQDARSGACKWVMQINPVVMSSDLIARPHYYGIKLDKWVITSSSNVNTLALLEKVMGVSVVGKKITEITSYLRKNIKDPRVNMWFAALILHTFANDKRVASRPLPNLKNYIAVTKQTLKNKGVKVEDAKLNDLIARIQKGEQPLAQQYRILWRYNTGPAYGLKVLYSKLCT